MVRRRVLLKGEEKNKERKAGQCLETAKLEAVWKSSDPVSFLTPPGSVFNNNPLSAALRSSTRAQDVASELGTSSLGNEAAAVDSDFVLRSPVFRQRHGGVDTLTSGWRRWSSPIPPCLSIREEDQVCPCRPVNAVASEIEAGGSQVQDKTGRLVSVSK